MTRNLGRSQHVHSQEGEIQLARGAQTNQRKQNQSKQKKQSKSINHIGAAPQVEPDRRLVSNAQTHMGHIAVPLHSQASPPASEGSNEQPEWIRVCMAKIERELEKSVTYEAEGMEHEAACIVAMKQASEMLQAQAQLKRSRFTTPTLSPQAYRALVLYSQGYTATEIARQWGVSYETVKTHLGRACTALGVTHRKDAVFVARSLAVI